MPSKSKILFRNKNQTGWWIYCEVERWTSNRQKKLTPNSRCLVYENTRLIKAKNREDAYRKALRLGKIGDGAKTTGGEWHFAGISFLSPVYEEIKDGAEILWCKHESMPLRKIRELVKSKQQLPVFNDRDRSV